jgi:hypothetical protein
VSTAGDMGEAQTCDAHFWRKENADGVMVELDSIHTHKHTHTHTYTHTHSLTHSLTHTHTHVHTPPPPRRLQHNKVFSASWTPLRMEWPGQKRPRQLVLQVFCGRENRSRVLLGAVGCEPLRQLGQHVPT